MTSTRNDARQDLYGGAFKKVVKQFFPILLFEKKERLGVGVNSDSLHLKAKE